MLEPNEQHLILNAYQEEHAGSKTLIQENLLVSYWCAI